MLGVKAFHELVKKGDLPAVEAAVTEDPQLPALLNDAGQTAFLLAKYYRQEAVATYLLSVHPDLDLFEASAAGQQAAVERFIQQDPQSLHARSSDGWTPLHLAAFFGHPDLARSLIAAGADVNARSTNAMKNTPLHAAAAGGKTVAARVLLEHGATVNATQEGGWTALHSAAQSGHRELLEVLLAHGGDLKLRAANNQSPLDLALLGGHAGLVELLEQLGGGAAAGGARA